MSTDISIENTTNPNTNNNTYGYGYTTFDISANFYPLTLVPDSSTNVLEYGFVWGKNDEGNNMSGWDSSNNYGVLGEMIDPHPKLLSVYDLSTNTLYYTRAYLKDASSNTYHWRINYPFLPSGLIEGDTFQLVFVTSDISGATSSNIDDYNNFVQNQWDNSSNLVTEFNAIGLTGISWKCIGSTEDVSANVNTEFSAASGPTFKGIYRLDGVIIADNSGDMWDGSLDAAINIDENGDDVGQTYVWTGTNYEGGVVRMYGGGKRQRGGLGWVPEIPPDDPIAGTGRGQTQGSASYWIEENWNYPIFQYPFYALSEVLTCPPPADPAALAVFTTHAAPEIDILSITDISGMDDLGGEPGQGYITATWNANITSNQQADISSNGFVWKQGGGNPTIEVNVLPPAPPGFPPGLNPGDTFQLAFITSDKSPATSPTIAIYDFFVQNMWNGSNLKGAYGDFGLENIDWKCIASTTEASANEHAVVGTGSNFKGVYRLDGEQIAYDASGMWNGSLNQILNINEKGQLETGNPEVWTGSDFSGGVKKVDGESYGLGSTDNTGYSWIGYPKWQTGAPQPGHWIDYVPQVQNVSNHLYALSDELTVPIYSYSIALGDASGFIDWHTPNQDESPPTGFPPGLSYGDTFQLVFVTSDISGATSTDIDDYNNFVQNQWDSSSNLRTDLEAWMNEHHIIWKCIGSTETVDAIDNVDTDPGSSNFRGIYRLDGEKVVDTSGELWDTGDGGESLLSPINIDEDGVEVPVGPLGDLTFTGTDWTGGKVVIDGGLWLGSTTYDGSPSNSAAAGHSHDNGSTWLYAAPLPTNNHHNFYALSEVLTVPARYDISYNVQDLSDNHIQNTVRGFVVFQDTPSSFTAIYTDLSENFYTHIPPSITDTSLFSYNQYPTITDISWNGTLINNQQDISACGFIWGPSSEGIGPPDADDFNITYSSFPDPGVPFTFDVSCNSSNFKIAPEYNGTSGTGGTRWLYPAQPTGEYEQTLSGLAPNTLYQFKFFIIYQDTSGTVDVSFTPQTGEFTTSNYIEDASCQLSIVNTTNPNPNNNTYGHGYTTFDISANFWPLTQSEDSSTNVLEYGFVWGTSSYVVKGDWDSSNNYGAISEMIDPHPKLLSVQGLSMDVDYYAKAYLKDASSGNFSLSSEPAVFFKTHDAPEIDILPITDISGVFESGTDKNNPPGQGYTTATWNASSSWEQDPLTVGFVWKQGEGNPTIDVLSIIPPGLIQGDTFQLVFVTSDTSGATSSNIDDYNNFVQNQWDNSSNLVTEYDAIGLTDISWNCIGSTNDTSANVNTEFFPAASGPNFRGIYRLDGVKIADNSENMWDGSLDASMCVNENGEVAPVLSNTRVWTGTNETGGVSRTSTDEYGLGSGSPTSSTLGFFDKNDGEWIDAAFSDPQSVHYPFYAISKVLTVPDGIRGHHHIYLGDASGFVTLPVPSPPEGDISYNVQDLSDNNIQNTVRGFVVFEDSSSSLQIVYTDLSENFLTHEPPSITTVSLDGESIYPTTADISWNGTLKNDQKDISACGFIWGESVPDIDNFDISYSDFPTVPFTFDVSCNNSDFKIAPEYNGNPGTGGTRWLYPEQPTGEYEQTLSGLAPDTLYQFKFFIIYQDTSGTVDVSFTPQTGSVTTLQENNDKITEIGIGNTENPSSNGTYGHGYTTFDISANFWPLTQHEDSSTNVLEYGFVWGKTDASNNMLNWDSSNNYGNYNSMPNPHKKLLYVHGLTLETQYSTRAYLKDASSDEYHFSFDLAEFTTHTIPEIDILPITDISGVFESLTDEDNPPGQGYTTATWNADISSNYQQDISACGFVWKQGDGNPTIKDTINHRPAGFPSGLNPGDTFQLVFVTSDTSGATSSNIDDYNNFVQNQWDNSSNLVTEYDAIGLTDISWNCIGSTNDTSANVNTEFFPAASGPNFRGIYRLDGVKIADNSGDMWDGALNALISVDENSEDRPSLPDAKVWTGTNETGGVSRDGTHEYGLGSVTPAPFSRIGIYYGLPNPGSWIEAPSPEVNWNAYPFYALSVPLTVPNLGIFIGDASGFVNLGPNATTEDISYNVQDLSDNHIQNTVRGFVVFQDTSSSLQIVYTDLSENFLTHEPPSITDTTFPEDNEVNKTAITADISWNGTLINHQKDISACGFIWGPSSELIGPPDADDFNIIYSGFPNVPFTFDVSCNGSNFKIAPEYDGNPGTGGTRWLYPAQPTGGYGQTLSGLTQNTEYQFKFFIIYQDTSGTVDVSFTPQTGEFTTLKEVDIAFKSFYDNSQNTPYKEPGYGYTIGKWETDFTFNIHALNYGYSRATSPVSSDPSEIATGGSGWDILKDYGHVTNTQPVTITQILEYDGFEPPGTTYWIQAWVNVNGTTYYALPNYGKEYIAQFPPEILLLPISDISGIYQAGDTNPYPNPPGQGYRSATWNNDINNNYLKDISACGFVWKAGIGDPSLNVTITQGSEGVPPTVTYDLGGTADASGFINLGPNETVVDISHNVKDLSNNGKLFKAGQEFTVRGWWGYQDTSCNFKFHYTDASKSFTTHKPPFYDISSTLDPSSVPDGYVTQGWWTDISQNYQKDISACGFVWKPWTNGDPGAPLLNSIDPSINLFDTSWSDLSKRTDFQDVSTVYFYTVDSGDGSSGLLAPDTSYNVRTWWKFQDTSSTSLIYYDPSENGETYNTIRTLTPPAGQVTAIPPELIGEAYARLEGKITINKQEDILGYGFVWADSNSLPTIADTSYNLVNSPPITTTPSFTLDISGLDYSLVGNAKTYYVRTFVQYESSGSSLVTSYGGGVTNFNTAYLGVPVFSDNLTSVAWDPSYSRTNIILDISVNPPLDPSSIYSPGAISSIGIYYDTSENLHNWTGSDPWYKNMPSVRRYPQDGINYIFEGSGNHIDNSMNSLYPWEGTIEASGHILEPNTIYFARAFAINPSGDVYAGKDISFTTLELELPTIITEGVVPNESSYSLTIRSTVKENEGDASGTHNWGWVEKYAGVLLLDSETYLSNHELKVETPNVIKTNILTDISSNEITFNITVDNLEGGIIYYFRSFISNKYNIQKPNNYNYGEIHYSYTPTSLPNIIVNLPTNIDTSSCTFNATMYDMGDATTIYNCGFIWSRHTQEINEYTNLKTNGDGISYYQQYQWSPSWASIVPIGNNTLSYLKFDTLPTFPLVVNSQYYVTLYIYTNHDDQYDYYPPVLFKTKGYVPQCITTDANEIGYTSVHLHGELLSNPPIPQDTGTTYVLAMGFIWDTSKNFHENGLNLGDSADGSYNIMKDEHTSVYNHFSEGGIGPFDISLNMGMIDKQLPDGIYKHFQPNTDYYWAPIVANLTNTTIGAPAHFKTKDISAVIVDILDGPWLHTYGSRIVEITDVSNGNNGVDAFLYAENHGFVDGQQVFLFAESTNTTFQADEFNPTTPGSNDCFSIKYEDGKLYYITSINGGRFQLTNYLSGISAPIDISNSDIPVDPNNHMSPITPAGTVTVRLGPLSSGIFDASFSSRTDLVMEISNNTGDYGGTVFSMDSDASGVGNLLKNTGINNLNFGFCWSSTNEYSDISNCDASSISNWNPPFSDISASIQFNLTNTIYHIRLFGISGELSGVNHTAADTEASGNIYYSDPLAFTSVFHPSGGILDDFGWVWEKDTSNNLQRNVANTFIPPPNADIIYLNHPADVSAVIVDISKNIYSRDMQLSTLDPSSVYYIRAYANNGSSDTNDNFVQNTNLFDPSYVDTSYNIHSKISNFNTRQELLIDASATQDPSSSIFGDISSYKMSLNKVLLEGSCAFENPYGCTKWGFVWDTSSNYNNLVDASRLKVNRDQIGDNGFWPPNSTDSSGIWVDSSGPTAPGKWPTPYSYNLTGSTESPDEPDNIWGFEIYNDKITSLIWYYFRAWGLSKDLTGGEFGDGFAYSKTLKFKAPTACGWTTTKPPTVFPLSKNAKPVENFSYERISNNFTNGKKTGYNIKLSWSDTSYNTQGILLRRTDVTENFYKKSPPHENMNSNIWDASSELYPIIQNLQFETEYIFTIHTYSHNQKCNVDISQKNIITNDTDYRSYSIPKEIIIPDNRQIDVEKRIFEDACATVPKDALQIQLSQNFNALPKKIKYSFLAKNPTGFGDKSRRNVICGGWLPPGSDPSSGSI